MIHEKASLNRHSDEAVNEHKVQTPEWKELALRKQDLFSPAGLESMFHKPSTDADPSPLKQSFSFDQDLSYYPSSPPPWSPPAQPMNAFAPKANKSTPMTTLEPLQEQEEEDLSTLLGGWQGHTMHENTRGSGEDFNDPRLPGLNRDRSASDHRDNAFGLVHSKSALPNSSSSITDGFSPVYISKHNTVDGRVDYAAFDPTRLPKLSEHVSVQRGGKSDDGSFKRKPLSSSVSSSALPSESLAPSDSVSQVRKPSPNKPSKTCHSPKENTPVGSPKAASSIPDKTQDIALSEAVTVQYHPLGLNQAHQNEATESSIDAQSMQKVVENRPEPGKNLTDYGTEHTKAGQDDISNLGLRGESIRDQEVPAAPDSNKQPQSDDTLHPTSLRDSTTSLETTVHHSGPQSVAGKKRKDARYDSDKALSNASSIAKREILRPRNPTPWQGQREHGGSTSVSDGIGSPASESAEQSLLVGRSNVRAESRSAAKARALASEAATFRIRKTADQFPGDRKKSVSTQDYLDEAMRIMDLIRARKQAATSDWSSNTGMESELWDAPAPDDNGTAQTISRPPSREGSRTAWRSQASRQIDPTVERHLRRYEETGDESFLVSSIVRSIKITEQAQYQHEQDGVRITDNPHREGLRRNSDPQEATKTNNVDGLNITRSSNGDTEGSEETQKTSSTQKLSSLGRIAPEQVSHLIREEEAGMRFDTDRQTWVKCKALKPMSSYGRVPPSSATTDDDPLAQIPDLTVNEDVEQHSLDKVSSQGSLHQPQNAYDVELSVEDEELAGRTTQDFLPLRPKTCKTNDAESSLTLIEPLQRIEEVKEEVDEVAEEQDIGGRCERAVNVSLKSVEGDEEEDVPGELVQPVSPCRDKHKRREQSVFFSSPPVSREWAPQHWTDSTNTTRTFHDNEDADEGVDNSRLLRRRSEPAGSTSPRRRGTHRHWSRNVSMSHTEQHQEISFIEHRPDGRTFSLSMSVSTPGAARRRNITAALPPSALRQSSFMESLSPLSDFSISNDDARHVRANALARPVDVVRRDHGLRLNTALTTNELVGKLTDIEPNEPYWDFMHRLSIADKNLDTINMLDEFCPRLEELDVSQNHLRHVHGAPTSLRHLDLSHNQLTGLTDLSHLRNLQYVNLANNGLSSLEGFGNLVHLRDINADCNEITCVDGILDLDGLLSISLRKNKLESVDFSSAQLKRLSHVNLSENQIDSLSGLQSLHALLDLDLQSNSLAAWPGDAACASESLELLKLTDNRLTAVDITHNPSLRTLLANNNTLSSITGIETHKSLQTVQLSNQSATITTLDPFANLIDLHLCGTSLPPLLPLTTPMLNLHTLDVAFTGLQALPGDFGALCPHLQTLNLNSNNLKDLRPLDGIVALRHLSVARNRITRLRKFVRALNALGTLIKSGSMLEEIDARGNPLTTGFYYGEAEQAHRNQQKVTSRSSVMQDVAIDAKYMERLDEESSMKRRVYEMLVRSKCPRLGTLDGLTFETARVEKRDRVWEKLVEVGVVQKVGGSV